MHQHWNPLWQGGSNHRDAVFMPSVSIKPAYLEAQCVIWNMWFFTNTSLPPHCNSPREVHSEHLLFRHKTISAAHSEMCLVLLASYYSTIRAPLSGEDWRFLDSGSAFCGSSYCPLCFISSSADNCFIFVIRLKRIFNGEFTFELSVVFSILDNQSCLCRLWYAKYNAYPHAPCCHSYKSPSAAALCKSPKWIQFQEQILIMLGTSVWWWHSGVYAKCRAFDQKQEYSQQLW